MGLRQWPLTALLLINSIEGGATEKKISAGPPPEVIPPSDKCSCNWSEWINEDSPKDDDGITLDIQKILLYLSNVILYKN